MDDATQEVDPKQRLILAAVEVFAEKGFKAATVREIVERAAANIAAINYHFGDKENLYFQACKHAHACSAAQEPPPQWPDGTPPRQKLEEFIRIIVRSMTVPSSPAAMQLLMRELANPTAAARQIVHDYIQPMAFTLRAILRELFPTAEPRRLLMVGFSIIGQCLYYRQNRPVSELIFGSEDVAALTPELIADHIVRFTLAALGQAPPIGPADLEAVP